MSPPVTLNNNYQSIIIKTQISKLVHMSGILNTLHQVKSQKIGKKNNDTFFVVIKPKFIKRITKIRYGHLCLGEENLKCCQKIEWQAQGNVPRTTFLKSHMVHTLVLAIIIY